jgi:hypothetical protein
LAASAKATPEQNAMRKAGLLQAISQLDMLIQMFGEAPKRVLESATEFKEALKEWAEQ